MRAPTLRGLNRPAAALLAAPLLCSVLVSCGGDDPAEPAADTTPSASSSPSAAEESETASPSTTPSESSEETAAAGEVVDAEALLERMKAAVNESTSARFTMDIGAAGQTITAEGVLAYRGQGAELDMTMELPGVGEMRMISVDGRIFAAIPGLAPAGKFVELDESVPGMGPVLEQLRSTDPLSSFDAFDAGLQEATSLGQGEVDGEPVERYRFVVDSAAAAEAQGTTFPPGTPKTIDYEVWLDEQDLMRRVEFAFPVQGQEVTGLIEADGWGEPVTIAPPPDKDVVQGPAA